MVYNYKEVIEIYKSYYKLKKAIKNKEIFKIENGLYSNKRINSPLIKYSKKYPNAVITMDSAFYFYDLTDVIPSKTYIATDRNADKIIDDKVVQFYMSKTILYKGRETKETENGEINIYNRERLLVELIRRKNKIPFDYYKEIISNYRKIVDELDIYKIETYLSLFKNGTNLSKIIQLEVF